MRPLSLTLEGFRSHQARTTIDLESRTLIAIVGPTGSGKSSILDALSFALYYKTPRFTGGARGLKSLICSRSEAAKVQLRFEADGTIWTATRSLPRRGSGQHLLEDDAGEKITGATEVSQKIEELLGLDFGAFTSSVLLAQGQFSRFLEATTTERMKILKGVFRLERIGELRKEAAARRKDIEIELAKIEGERNQIPGDARALLAEAREQEKEWVKRVDELGTAIPEEKRLTEIVAAAEAAEAQAKVTEKRVAEELAKIPPPDDFEVLFDEESKIERSLSDAREASSRASTDLQAAQKDLESLERRLGAEADLREARAEAVRLFDTATTIAELGKEIATRSDAAAKLQGTVEDAERSESQAAAKLDAARDELRKIEHAHSAHALRTDLKPGEPCPVCEQKITEVPKSKRPAALTQVRKSVSTAEKDHQVAIKKTTAVRSERDIAQTRLEESNRSLDEKKRLFARIDETLRPMVGNVSDPKAEIEERLAQIDKARGEVDAARELVERIRSDLDAVVAEQQKFASRRQKLAAALVGIAGKFDIEQPDIEAPAEKLASHADQARETLGDLFETARKALVESTEIKDSASVELIDLRESLELVAGGTIADALGEAKTNTQLARREAEQLESKIERAKELEVSERALTDRKAIYDQLADDLRDERFVNFLLEDRRRLLSDLGSARLREMTGRYRFDDEGEFDIIDELDADKRRSVETLSGGETFLASLALALALAETVARHGGRLQCFFIDEGFGSLDPESLDLALDGIERIVGPDRLIGLVSHVAEMARRVEDKIVLEKSPEGTTILVEGAV